MKTQKGLAVLATVSLLGLSVACNDRYQEGFAAGKDQGYREGYDNGYGDGDLDGYDRGFAEAKVLFASADYNAGFNAGKQEGIAIGFTQGQTAGYNRGYDDGYDDGALDGYDLGYDDGMLDGYDFGYEDGMLDGYDLGYDDGVLDGYDLGYDDGWYDGYDVGYEDGYYGLSVGKTKALKGYANILSMAHNDIIDYSKIKAPKQTARGVVANGRLLFEETSLTVKDTLKRKAVVEQYLTVEMSKQIAKLGLSAERSLQIAKAANHFRKSAATGSVSKAATNLYASEIIGADLETIQSAMESGSMKSVLEAAAKKNGTSPEKMAEIISKHFI